MKTGLLAGIIFGCALAGSPIGLAEQNVLPSQPAAVLKSLFQQINEACDVTL